MDMLKEVSNLKGNQRLTYRQLLKSTNKYVFVDDVCNFTGLTESQVRSAFRALMDKNLVRNLQPHPAQMNIYTLNH